MRYTHPAMAKTKTTQPRTKKDTSEATAPKLVMLTGQGHRVSRNVTARADCGVRMTGWRYGTTKDVTCKRCLGEEASVEVPPGQFEVEEVLKELGVEGGQ